MHYFLVATILSCSSEDQGSQNVTPSAESSGSILDGKVLSFKNEESFVKEYSDLAALKNEELKSWISSKKVVSLLNTSDISADMEEDVLSESRVIYSDALKSILNEESKVKIDGKVLWLNERSFYLLSENEINKSSKDLLAVKDKLEVYGQLLNVSGAAKSLTSRDVLPNENRVKTFATPEMSVGNSRLRHVIDLYNETVVLNNQIQTSKMFVRSTLQYRSCSTIGGCKWKEAMNLRRLGSSFCESCNGGAWGTIFNISSASEVTGSQTYLLSNWRLLGPPYHPNSFYPNFIISGPITCHISGSNPAVVFSTDLSWY